MDGVKALCADRAYQGKFKNMSTHGASRTEKKWSLLQVAADYRNFTGAAYAPAGTQSNAMASSPQVSSTHHVQNIQPGKATMTHRRFPLFVR